MSQSDVENILGLKYEKQCLIHHPPTLEMFVITNKANQDEAKSV